MFSNYKISIAGIGKFCLALALCIITVTACSRSARPGAESASLASVALVLLSGVPREIGVSTSMEAFWISGEKQWNDVIASIPAEALEFPPQPLTVPDVDFAKHGILLIRMGEKPSGGYGLTLMADTARIENRTAVIPVRWSEPQPDMMYTQAFTYPYLVIKMEKGSFDSIAIVDQDGKEKLRLSI